MNIQRDAQVLASDGYVGRVRYVIVDPRTREVMDIVVGQDGPDGREWLVPISGVVRIEDGAITLDIDRETVYHGYAFHRDAYRPVDDEAVRWESIGQALNGGAPLLDASDDALEIGARSGEPHGPAAGGGVAMSGYEQDRRSGPESESTPAPADDDIGDGQMPLSDEAVAAGTAIVGERSYEYTYAAMGGYRPGEPPAVGVPVVTSDGDVLGTVGEVAADRFKVAAPLAPDYWLPNSAVTGIAPGGDLVVSLPKDQVRQAEVPPPGDGQRGT